MLRTALLLCVCVSIAAASDVTGKWDFTAQTPSGEEFKADLTLRNDGAALAGTMATARGTADLQEIRLAGDQLTFKLAVHEALYGIKLTVGADSMKGSYSGPDGSSGSIMVKRAGGSSPALAASGKRIAGQWKVLARSSDGNEYNLDLVLTVTDGKVSGTLTSNEGTTALIDPKLEGSNLTFQVTTGDGTYSIKLTAAGQTLTGSFAGPGRNGTITAKR
jgi:hypothetical protein